MKKVLFCFCACLAFVFSSCGNKGALEDLLKTVPKTTKFAMVIDLTTINEKLNAEDGKSLQGLISSSFGSQMDPQAKAILSDESSINFNAPAVVFEFNEQPVVSFYVKNETDFIKFSGEQGETLTKKDGIYVNSAEDLYLKDGQVWVARLSPSIVKNFSNLKKDNSFMSLKIADKMLDAGADVATGINISELGSIYDREAAQFVAALNLLFDDPQYAIATADFEKGKMMATLDVLNGKGDPSACAIHPANIDIASLSEFQAKGEVFGAIGIDTEFMQQVVSKIQAIGAPPAITTLLNTLEGNIVFSFDVSSYVNYMNNLYSYYDSYDSSTPSMPSFAVQFTFKSPGDAHQAVSLFSNDIPTGFNLQTNGNKVTLSCGNPMGVPITAVADYFKNASMGVAFTSQSMSNPKMQMLKDFITGGYLVWKNNGKGLSLELKLDTKKDQNSLITFFKLGSLAATM